MIQARTRIKLCGLGSAQDLAQAAELGVDMVGFVFHPRSPRNVSPADVAAWLRDKPALVHSVFLFMDPEPAAVHAVLDTVTPDFLQFHGAESAPFCRQFGLDYFKALAMGAPEGAAQTLAEHQRCKLWVADSHGGAVRSGGSGQRFDWLRLNELPRQVLVAGGLNPGNVTELIQQHRPWGVDVSSGIESAPGVKCARKMQAFVRAVWAADADFHSPDRG